MLVNKYITKLDNNISLEQNRSGSLENKYRISRIEADFNFDFVTGCQEIEVSIRVEFRVFWSYFVFYCILSFAFITFSEFFFLFQDKNASLKKAPGMTMKTRYFSLPLTLT